LGPCARLPKRKERQKVVENAAEAANKGEQVKNMILHHITNGWDISFPSSELVSRVYLNKELWKFHLGGLEVNMSISRHVVMMMIAAGLLILLGLLARRRLALVPQGLANVLEAFVLFIRDDIAVPNMGKKTGLGFTPYLCSTFFFILACNLLGLIPYGSAATGNVSVTAGLAFMSFLAIQFAGMRKMGVFGYFKHLVPAGVPWWMAPIMIAVELMGICAKPFALCVRLFANMVAGHVVILSLIGLVFVMSIWVFPLSLAFGVFMYFLELFVGFLQAYIFTMLTAVFIGLLVAESH